ncbi:MAG TPA: Smr/MutS family protein [Candidatus Mcinerneyibacteriales bacterium]|nr:Smr/MutS family protein [Candidatus Mcinerneyibacteriales bacterium]HPJ70050.1 Smr/MutS family protein [Candidatus Mcinerneyibacteriales bacterium]HPQ89646.1 Smr/MutS family protein [Candidatus Mcinerneyibacteriales bacterium]
MKTINTEKLEFHIVLDRVKALMLSERARQIADETAFSYDLSDVRFRLDLVEEGLSLYLEKDDFEIRTLFDIMPLLDEIEKGLYYHLPGEYKKTQRVLEESRRLGLFLKKLPEQWERVKDYGFGLASFDELISFIDSRISEEGEVRENATPELRKLRQRQDGLSRRMEQELGKLLKQYAEEGALQEDFYTTRNDRYVIPVRAQSAKKVNGIVQGGSGSGNTVFMEPMSLITLNNENMELRYALEEEMRRILTDIGRMISGRIREVKSSVENLYYLDFLLGKIKYASLLNGTKPRLNDRGEIDIIRGRHPLLDPKKCVPIDIWIKDGKRGLIITGPNAGGKSVSLKTIGLFTLMSMYGLLVPAEKGTLLSIFEEIFVDIGDFQSIQENLSTFSGHIRNLKTFAEEVNHSSLVLLDEVGVGTDPEEGAALALSLITHFLDKGAVVVVTTHYNALKRQSMDDERLENASCLFDYDRLEPLYAIKVGIPGSSNGLLVAGKLGMPPEVIRRAKSFMAGESVRLEEIISKLERELSQAEQLKKSLQVENKNLQSKMAFYESELKKITDKRNRKKLESLADFESEFHQIRDQLKDILKSFREKQGEEQEIMARKKEIEKTLTKIHRERQRVEERMEKIKNPVKGERIFLEKFGVSGRVCGYDERKKEYEIDCNGMILRVPASQMIGTRLAETETPAKEEAVRFSVETRPKFMGKELVLVGMKTEEALDNLRDFLPYAVMKGFESVKIIHGVGTGRLREAVQEFLRESRVPKKFYDESSRGAATIVEL